MSYGLYWVSCFCNARYHVFYCYAGSRYAEYCDLIVMLSVVILHAAFFTAMPSVVILRAVMPNVLAPFFSFSTKSQKTFAAPGPGTML